MGAQTAYTYRETGVTAAYLGQQMPGTGTVASAVPIRYQTITWDSDYKDDLDAAMASAGWTFAFQGSAPAAKTIAQIQSAVLLADGSAVVPADGWVTKLSRTLTTRGGSNMGVQVTAVGNTGGSGVGAARILANGGSFSNTVIGADQYDLHDANWGFAAFHHPLALPDTSPTETEYTLALQFSVTGVGSSLVPRKGCVVTLVEYP